MRTLPSLHRYDFNSSSMSWLPPRESVAPIAEIDLDFESHVRCLRMPQPQEFAGFSRFPHQLLRAASSHEVPLCD